jgi:integrase
VDTKNGKNRFVPVDGSVFLQIKERLQQSPFKDCYWAYRVAFKRSALVVSVGQLAHVLRHTFASHFIMNGGNVLTLQRILGHSSLNVTMRYSHLSPDFLHQAIKFNPLAIKDTGKKVESVE